MPPKQSAHRTPFSIDDVAIDFTTVKPATGATASSSSPVPDATQKTSAVIPGLLELMQQQRQDDGRQKVSDVRAFDPSLQGIAQRQLNGTCIAACRRKKVFGGKPYTPPSAEPVSSSTHEKAVMRANVQTNSGDATAAAAQDALQFLITSEQKRQQLSSPSDLQKRRELYTQQLRAFCQRGRRSIELTSPSSTVSPTAASASFPHTRTSHTNSLLIQLFADGVPDIEPWDRWTSPMPRYGDPKQLLVNPHSATKKQIHDAQLDLLHHPVIPDTHYTRHYQYRDLETPIIQKEFKTKDELRAERRERLKEKQAKKKQERLAATSTAATLNENNNSNTGGSALLASSATNQLLHDRLSTKNLTLNLFASSVLNPLAADTKVLQQYELRDLEHQRRNHDRHVAALPNQILKRARDQQRHATERPILRAYRIYPIYAPAHLGKLRHYANDNLLRGFILYVAGCDAVVVFAGGEAAARHLDRWIVQKMEWEHPETRATRLMTVPLMDAESFSFHLPKAQGGGGRVYKQGKLVDSVSVAATAVDASAGSALTAKEPVFINMVSSVEEGERFLRQLPAPSSPWADLSAVWRTAFLQDGLQMHE